jgi:hypothetical protein
VTNSLDILFGLERLIQPDGGSTAKPPNKSSQTGTTAMGVEKDRYNDLRHSMHKTVTTTSNIDCLRV